MTLTEFLIMLKLSSGSSGSGGGGDYDKYFEGGYADVNLPNATKLKGSAFQYDQDIVSFVGERIKEVGDYGFARSFALATVQLPILESVGEYVFSECTSLVIEDLPETLQSLGTGAFNSCTSLQSVTFHSTPTIGSNCFKNCTNLQSIKVPWSKGAVKGAPWGASSTDIIIYNYTGD